jgi:hypothetical protein
LKKIIYIVENNGVFISKKEIYPMRGIPFEMKTSFLLKTINAIKINKNLFKEE